MRTTTLVALTIIVNLGVLSTSDADSTGDKLALAMKNIAAFATEICVPRGDRTVAEIKGDLGANVAGLLSKLANLDVRTSGSFKKEAYTGILQDRIIGESLDPAACKLKVMKEWKDVYLSAN